MNLAHLHLALIHFPIAGAFLALPLLALALWRKAERGATLGAAIVLAIAAISAGAAVNTGEGAEEVVEGLAGVEEDAIHAHEEAAEVGMVVSIATGAIGIAAAGLALAGRGTLATRALVLALVADLVAAGAMARAGNLGGAIRHPEIGADAGAGPSSGAEGAAPARLPPPPGPG